MQISKEYNNYNNLAYFDTNEEVGLHVFQILPVEYLTVSVGFLHYITAVFVFDNLIDHRTKCWNWKSHLAILLEQQNGSLF